MSRRALVLAATLAGLLTSVTLVADTVRPVQVQIKEREPGSFLVQWRTPKLLPPQAVPSVVMPEGCRTEGERVFLDQPSGWLNRQVYRCSEGLAGQTIGMSFPVYNPSINTVIRVEFLSGERFAHALTPLEESWRVPDANVGSVAAWLRDARFAAVSGVRHVLSDWVHVAFLLALILLGGMTGSVRLVTAFAVGQVVAVAATAVLGRAFEPRIAEICVAIAVVFLAREALRPLPQRRRLDGLAAGAGLFHGLALASLLPAAPESVVDAGSELLVLALGMDAAMLVLAVAVTGVGGFAKHRWRTAWLRPVVTYVIGGTAVAAALSLAFVAPVAETVATVSTRVPGMSGTSTAGLPGSRRLAPQTLDAPIQNYLAVEPFEVRNEVLVRVRDVAIEIGFDSGDDYVEIDAQQEVARSISELIASRAAVEIDGEAAEGFVDRVSFMTADATGVLPRQTPVREAADEALVGVTLVYLTSGMPDEVQLAWETFSDAVPAIPATVIDPEASVSAILTEGQPALRWKNELMENPVPTVAGVAVEPARLPLPLISLALFVAAVALFVSGLRGWRRTTSFAAARIILALALVAGPLAQMAVALPASLSRSMSEAQARRILAGVLPNVYRAFEFRDEATAYDRLAVAVTGEVLTDVYLEHRRSLEMQERGGARARVDAVEVLDVGDIEPRADGGFNADASWTVGGTVTHFGHRHFRQNRYNTRVAVVPVDGMWKIHSIEVLEQERIR